jgi:3-oxoadipate enol-lactonase / 4-carboxymuconolactone decarboxylase
MPLLTIGDASCYYRLDGAADRPVIVLSHSLGLDHGMWDAQAADLLPHFRVLRYDTRGHGASSATPGDYSIAELGRDVLAIVDACGVERFAFCGLSLGGMIGLWLAAHASERLTHLVLANTTSRLSDPQPMEARRRAVLDNGMSAIEDLVMGRFFSPAVLASPSPQVGTARRTLLSTNPVGYAGCCAAIRDMDQTELLARIRVPTLVISGDLDVGMPWDAHAAILTRAIEGARAVRLPAAHISNLERPRSFSAALLDFLVPAPAERRDAGFAVRRSVLGDAYVDRAIAGTTDFNRDLQELITSYAWGSIWTRPGLDHRTRRLLVLTATAALGRWEEFRLHVRTGLAHELEPCDLREVLLQVAVYAGVPAANAAFHIASEIFDGQSH